VWNRLLDDEVATVVANARLYTDLSPRELAFLITDAGEFSVSESSVYRILKREGLQHEVPWVVPAAKEYPCQTTRVNEWWQTDLTDMLLPGWGQYPVGGVLDDFSRFSLVLRRLLTPSGEAVQERIAEAIHGQRKPPKELTQKARRKANLTHPKNPRKKRSLQTNTLPKVNPQSVPFALTTYSQSRCSKGRGDDLAHTVCAGA